MATKNKPNLQADPAPVDVVAIGTEINLEDAIADQLLDDIDWSKVKAAMLTKVKQRFFTWLTSGGDRPVNISQFPELAVLPSGDEQEKAA
jgi:hypothetical protein